MSDVLLAIETSCDETSAAVIDRSLTILSNVVASQNELHERFGGVVPEIASRAHVRRIVPVIDEALESAGFGMADLAAIAAVTEPGLVGSLLVGLTAAKTLAAVWEKPLVAVNHLEAHLYACRMAAGRDVFPAVGFVVSGGHSNLYDCVGPSEFRPLGGTIDDAAGEAFDKVAQILGLPYPGGPSIQKAAEDGDPKAVALPRPMLNSSRLAFSFSGLKTALLYEVRGIPGSGSVPPPLTPQRVADLAASFQAAAVDVLVAKCRQALKETGRKRLLIGGGVAANAVFRSQVAATCDRSQTELVLAPPSLCTDNAAMAGLAWEHVAAGRFASLECDVMPGLVRI
ncbi:MAG: tRNA (adenosine(37)-N6)-threonylcarbamoyltransferase complex transferase subunit TsaD [Planctomycetota bacterium]|nr:tRNA (adenosine(37)-N6)-threonylcarbamoyltransferase complex transferase subunit TsaD [Planctomycetaceae bacterium]MDQ3331037.1 tRNA (adenosine(37)-N6)-threonylcarbamoyltransferase complex transferase subunit TsaD [Planctomycetota bacterium]